MDNFGIGKSVKRVEDVRFLTGRGRYVDDISPPGLCYGAVLLSTYAHARIRSIDVSAARNAPGVLCVLTGRDAVACEIGGTPPLFMPEDMGGPPGFRTYRLALCHEKVRYAGDRVAFVVAETANQARDAVELIEVDYDPLPAVVTPEEAIKDTAPQIHDGCANNRCCFVAFGDQAATDAAFERASHIVSVDIHNNRLTANSIEPRACIGEFNPAEDAYTLYTSSQNPHGVRTMIATHALRIPESHLRVISPDVGGGFGMKADPYPEDVLVLWAARICCRPVKWVASRSESLLGDTHGRDQTVHAEMALNSDGRILGVRVNSLHGFGAYVVSAAVAPLVFSIRFVPSVYDIKAYHGFNVGVFTNTSPTGPYRGAGRPEATFVIERLLDIAAARIGVDAITLRRKNLIPTSALPYSTATGFIYDSGNFAELLDRCLDLSGAADYEGRRAESARKGLLRGRGTIFFIEQGGVFNDQMGLRFDPGGTVTILAGTHSHGQSHATVFAQLISEWLGVPFDDIRYLQGDTDKVHFGRGTYAARSSMIGGSALRIAADRILQRARILAAHLLDVSPDQLVFEKGRFSAVGSDQSISLMQVAQASYRKGGLPPDFGVGLEASGWWDTNPPNFPNGCHICEVEIDPETGHVRVDRYNAVDDVGRALNPMICEGQIMGGITQGIGQALLEEIIYDGESGQLLTGSFMDYGMPRADDIPRFNLSLAEIPCTTNPLGVKAVGEAGTIGAPAAVINAVLDALRPLGVSDIQMPATPARVWEALRAARTAQAPAFDSREVTSIGH